MSLSTLGVFESYRTFYGESPSLCILTTVLGFVVTALIWAQIEQALFDDPTQPPVVRYYVPFIGSMVEFGMDPIGFMRKHREQHGDFFTFLMFGRKMTVCLGSRGNDFLFNAKHSCVTAEDAYNNLTKPVFGADVVYDVPNSVLMEQKRIVKAGLSTKSFQRYVPMIIKETNDYIDKHWTKDEDTIDIFKAISELIIMSASRTLLGKEIRAQLYEGVADLYHTLDSSFTPIHFLFEWLPLPSYFSAPKAHAELESIFAKVIKARRLETNRESVDMLDVFLTSKYKDGTALTDLQATNMCIALLMAGQHTSAATTTWALLNLANQDNVRNGAYNDMKRAMGEDLPYPEFENLKDLQTLDDIVRETLRIHPPIVQVLRKVVKPIPIPESSHIIPAGNYLMASPVIAATDKAHFQDPETFKPSRWSQQDEAAEVEAEDKNSENTVNYGWGDMSLNSAKSPYLPFGAGRHRCIGEQFAYIQIKTILYVLLKRFDFKLDEKRGMPKSDYNSMVVLPEAPVSCRYIRRK
ncbi:Lanosterol 14-alpha-demethylase [Mycoemilia scoparia]|uniref:Lanosterol 14-alpha-demethylase n=1 Tax=Mycoemilia scoparia TaxID=417184 RepID=A0A9W7ZVJ1_9FUNG|nr:Lanosterol 14-alpha-demethylase [Mycoemilia scoparia]